MSTELIHCLHNSMSMIGRLMQLWALAPAPGIYNLLTIIYKHTCRVDPMYTLYCIFISIISLLFIYLLLVSGSFCVFLGFSWIFNGIHLLNIQKYFVQLIKDILELLEVNEKNLTPFFGFLRTHSGQFLLALNFSFCFRNNNVDALLLYCMLL